jgi:hypothetical protein
MPRGHASFVFLRCLSGRAVAHDYKTTNPSTNNLHHRPAQRGAYNSESCPRLTLSLPTSLVTYTGCNPKTLSSSVRTGFSLGSRNSGRGQETRCSNAVYPQFTNFHPSSIWTYPLISALVTPLPLPILRFLRSLCVVHLPSTRVSRTVRLEP